ncbi:MAG: ATP-dependent Clp protease ATP-binding subunit [Eubacteriales bacterium]|nr:ATP-dependent Clp protease ATP-binding subunit [Eubacteriales bacterium]
MTNHFTKAAQNALNFALLNASDMGHTYIGSEHILLGLAEEKSGIAAKVLEGKGITREKIYEIISSSAGIGVKTNVSPSDFTPRAKKIIEYSDYYSKQGAGGNIGTEHILLAMSDEKDCVAMKILSSIGIGAQEIKSDILSIIGDNGKNDKNKTLTRQVSLQREKSASVLSGYGRDLTQLAKAKKTEPVIGRDEETLRVLQILSRKSKNNPCLIGEPGVGKTAIVEGLAARIADGCVPSALKNKTIFSLDLSLVIAGAKYRGEFEERMKNVMEEVSRNDSVILFIDEIHTIIGAGAAEGAVDAANILKPALARGEIQVIGATTVAEYRKKIEKDSALERRFQSVYVKEPSEEETKRILIGIRPRYEKHHGVSIPDNVIDSAVSLSCRYITDRYLPDKAIDLLDEACALVKIRDCEAPGEFETLKNELTIVKSDKEKAIITQDFSLAAALHSKEQALEEKLSQDRMKWEKELEKNYVAVTEEDIATVVNEWTGIPVKNLTEDEADRLSHLDERLKSKIIGQDDAVTAVATAIRRSRLGLKDPRRPIGSFLFLGPTGVGKTELARLLATELFGSETSLIRIDMSEFMEKHSVSKLIGSPPGYVGYEEGGYLTEKVKRRPYSLILLDEIEKAHPDVFNILLQILDDGTLTDSSGTHVSFKNTVIIMTSNVGASQIADKNPLGFSAFSENVQKKNDESFVMSELKKSFSPEFLNRIDDTVVFRRLSEDDIQKIAAIMLEETKARISHVGIILDFDSSAINLICKNGYNKTYGARHLRRTITHMVENALSEIILSKKIEPPCSLEVTEKDGRLSFFKKSEEHDEDNNLKKVTV